VTGDDGIEDPTAGDPAEEEGVAAFEPASAADRDARTPGNAGVAQAASARADAAEEPAPPENAVAPPAEEDGLTADAFAEDAFADAAEVAALGEGLFDDDEDDVDPAAAAPPASRPPSTPAASPRGADTAAGSIGPAASDREMAVADVGAGHVAEGARVAEAAGPDSVSRLGMRGNEEFIDLLHDLDAGPAAADADEERTEPVPTVTLASLYADQGFADRAIEIYQRVLEADPGNAAARTGLERMRGR
jgi:hypothetical protein